MRHILDSLVVVLYGVALLGSIPIVRGQETPVQPRARFDEADVERRNLLQQPVTPAEQKAWEKVTNTLDIKGKSNACDDYLKQFPEGAFVPLCHEIIAVYARQNNDLKKFFAHGELAVASLPDSVIILASLSSAYAEKQQPDPAIARGEQALAVVDVMEPIPGYTPDVWEAKKVQVKVDANYGVGTGYLLRAFNESSPELMNKAVTHLQTATQLNPQDQLSHFRLGFAYQVGGDDQKAVIEYARASVLGGVNGPLADQYLEQVYQKLHGDTSGMKDLLKEQKEYLEGQKGQ